MAYPTPLSGSVSPAVSYGSFAGTLGRFHYVRGLGEGAYGIVLQVWDPELQAHRAIKVPHRHLIESRRVDPEDYVREAQDRPTGQARRHRGGAGRSADGQRNTFHRFGIHLRREPRRPNQERTHDLAAGRGTNRAGGRGDRSCAQQGRRASRIRSRGIYC